MKRKKTELKNYNYLLAHHSSWSAIAEQYRTIRTNIQYTSFDKEIKTIMATSCGAGEGKSTTLVNLAITMAQQNQRVLLVDADLRKPTLPYPFRKQNNIGLTNIIVDQTPLSEAITATMIPNLDLLLSGPVPPNPSELLASHSMKQIMEELRRDYHYVLVDTPPILTVTDAQILANLCDGSILVIDSGATDSAEAIKGTRILKDSRASFLGIVLNKKKMKLKSKYYTSKN